jgi:hypothetical protein
MFMNTLRNSKRAKIHVFNDLPHLYESADMMEFCARYKHLYIVGAAENQEYLLKFFDSCGVAVDGYAVTEPALQCLRHWRHIPVCAIDDVICQSNTGVILALPDRYYRYFIPKFRKAGFTDCFTMTEYNKNTIAEQMKTRSKEEMTFEINLVDHCNLSCQMCDHYSQLSEERFVDTEVFERDMNRMGKIFDHEIACITLLGGEPTLHPYIIECMEITRREFPQAELIILTNGILLLSLEHMPNGRNIWQACKDMNVHITVTSYPLKFDYAALERKAIEYGVALAVSSNIHADKLTKIVKISDKHTFDPARGADVQSFASCLYFNKFNVLREGRYYMCPVAACIGIFNDYFKQNLQLTEADSLVIYIVFSYMEFAEFATKRTPFCGYCDLKKWGPHSEWKASTKSIDEYI